MPIAKKKTTKTTGTHEETEPDKERTEKEIRHDAGLDDRAFGVRKPEIRRGLKALRDWGN